LVPARRVPVAPVGAHRSARLRAALARGSRRLPRRRLLRLGPLLGERRHGRRARAARPRSRPEGRAPAVLGRPGHEHRDRARDLLEPPPQHHDPLLLLTIGRAAQPAHSKSGSKRHAPILPSLAASASISSRYARRGISTAPKRSRWSVWT